MISIVIRTYNEEKAIGKCLEILLNQTFEDFEIIIIDSSSTDRTIEIARKVALIYNKVKIFKISKLDFTYGKALNFGIENTNKNTNYIVLLSAHAYPTSRNWLNEFHNFMETNPNLAGVYGKQSVFKYHLKNWFVEYQNEFGYASFYKSESYITSESFYFSNANAIIRKVVWEKIKYDELLSYTEDWKWAIEVLKTGRLIGYSHKAEVFHSHPDSLSKYISRRKNEIKGTNNVISKFYTTLNFTSLVKKIIYNNPMILIKEQKNKKWSLSKYIRFLVIKTIDDLIIYRNA